jgi:hypothetical protein
LVVNRKIGEAPQIPEQQDAVRGADLAVVFRQIPWPGGAGHQGYFVAVEVREEVTELFGLGFRTEDRLIDEHIVDGRVIGDGPQGRISSSNVPSFRRADRVSLRVIEGEFRPATSGIRLKNERTATDGQ